MTKNLFEVRTLADIEIRKPEPHPCIICGELGPPGKQLCKRHIELTRRGKSLGWMAKHAP